MLNVVQATTDLQLANKAITSIWEFGCRATSADYEHVRGELRKIAQGDSVAAGAAMCTLAGGDDNDCETLKKRWANGDVLKLWKAGKLDGESLAGPLYEAGLLDSSSSRKLFKELDDHPAAKAELCLALLNTQRAFDIGELVGGKIEKAKLTFSIDMPKELRSEALDFLARIKSPKLDEILTRLQNKSAFPELVDKVQEIRQHMWSSERPAPPGEAAKCPFMVGDTLRTAVADFASASWSPSVEASKRYQKLDKAANLSLLSLESAAARAGISIEELTPHEIAEAMKTAPTKIQERYKAWCEKRQSVETALAELNEINSKRFAKVARELNLPIPELQFSATSDTETRASYKTGSGKIIIRDGVGAARPSANFLHSLTHELTHLEQDTLVIRHLADQMKLGKTATNTQIKDLASLYLKKTGSPSPLTPEFARAVIGVRDGRPLTEAEAARADKLQHAFLEHRIFEKQATAIDTWRTWLESSRDARENILRNLSGADLPGMSSRLDRSLRVAFGEVPEALKPLFKTLKEQSGDHEAQAKTISEIARVMENEIERMNKSGFAPDDVYKAYRENPIELESWAIQDRARVFAKAAEQKALADIVGKLKTNDAFNRLIDESVMRMALGNMSDQILKTDLSALSNDKERSECLTERLKEAMREQLRLTTNAELPDCLQKLRIEVTDEKAPASGAQTIASPENSVIKISADRLKADLNGVIKDAFLGASNIALLDVLNQPGTEKITSGALQPLLDTMHDAAKEVILAREVAVKTEAQTALNREGATDLKPGTSMPRDTFAMTWDGAHVAIGKEHFNVLKDLANHLNDKEKELVQAREDLKLLQEKISKSARLADMVAESQQSLYVKILTDECKALEAIDNGLKGNHGPDAQNRARAIVDDAVKRTVETKRAEARSKAKNGPGGNSTGSGGKLSAGGMFIASLAELYLESKRNAQGTKYGE